MTIGHNMLPELDHEVEQTRKMLKRVPDALADWAPHAKSFKMMRLAAHVARLPQWGAMTLTTTELDLAGMAQDPPIANAAGLVVALDEEYAKYREVLAKASDADMMVPWTLRRGDQVFFSMPRVAVLRSFVMNHLIHHRAQLGVYLRLNDIPVPGMYGPSADET